VVDALEAQLGIPAHRCSVHRYQPEDFLIVLATEELKSRVTSSPAIHHAGFSLFVRPWTRLAQATKVNNRQHVHLVLEGIPPHAWDKETAEELLGTSCVLEDLAPATREWSDLALFRLSAWTDNTEAIPPARTLVIPEPEEVDEVSLELARHIREEVSTLRYKVLIHIDSVEDDRAAPFDAPDGPAGDSSRSPRLGSGGRQRRWFQWQRGIPDRRGGGDANITGAGDDRRTYRHALAAPSDWMIPPMEGRMASHVASAGHEASRFLGHPRSNLAAPTKHADAGTGAFCNPKAIDKVWVRKATQNRPLERLVEDRAIVGATVGVGVGGAPSNVQLSGPTGVLMPEGGLDPSGDLVSEEDRDAALRWEDASDSLIGGDSPCITTIWE
jgi:hypothetical protein